MLISIVVPMYNAEKYISNCIDSIIVQDKVCELLLIDDGSVDKTLDIARDYEKKYSWITVYTQKNAGPSVARNRGIECAKGDWIMFVDADDWLEKNALRVLKSYIDIVDTDIIAFDYIKDGKKVSNGHSELLNNQQYRNRVLDLKYHFGLVWSCIYSSSFLKKYGFKFNESLTLSEDCEFMVKLSKKVRSVQVITESIYHYRVTGTSLSRGYKNNAADKYIAAIYSIAEQIDNTNEDFVIKESFFTYVCQIVIFISLNDFFHPDNHTSFLIKRKCFNHIFNYDIICNALRNVKYKEWDFLKRITLFCIKNHLTVSLHFIAYVKNKLMKR